MANSMFGDKIEFIQWLKNHTEQMKNDGEQIRQRLNNVRERNEMFAAQIQESYPQSYMSQTPMNTASQVTQQLAQKTMQACDQQITVKLDKIRKCNETIESRMKEEAIRSKQTLYDILNKDEISLKPYDEVVSATEELKQETDKILQESDDTKQEVTRVNGNFKMEYTQLTQDINNFEILTKELSLEISTLRNSIAEKLFSLNLKSSNSIPEFEELSKEIAELEAKLANYSKYV